MFTLRTPRMETRRSDPKREGSAQARESTTTITRIRMAATRRATSGSEARLDERLCEHADVPRIRPTSPIGLAYGAFYLWRRLPPAQRRQVALAARTHGLRMAAAVLAARRKPKA